MTTKNYTIPKRFYSLDILRGFASLSVVLWHWQHFYFNGTNPTHYNLENQPFYSLLFLFYNKGNLAVQLFFSLSGFIFSWLYTNKIKDRNITSTQFFWLRFSRLYPLHFLTLIIVTILQIIMLSKNSSYFVYTNNNLYHFVLNLFLISFWGFQKGYSYNGPIWSVSIEVLLYIVFFIYSLFRHKHKIISCLLIIALSIALQPLLPRAITEGVLCFFVGGIAYSIYLKLITFDLKKRSLYFGLTSLFLWLITIIVIRYNLDIKMITNNHVIQNVEQSVFASFYKIILFPVSIISLA